MEAQGASETALSLGARACSDMPAAASTEQLTYACSQHKKRHCARALSLGRKRSTLACGVRAPRRAGWSRPMPHALSKLTAPARRPSHSGNGRPLTCQPRPPTSSFLAYVRKKKRHRARSFSREEAQLTRLCRARAAPRWLESLRDLWKLTAPARRHLPRCTAVL